MNTLECIKTRRSIRKFKPDPVDHATLEFLIGAASYSPSWKNTQITRYIAIEDSSILDKSSATYYTPDFNAKIIKQAPMLIAVTFKKGAAVLNATVPTAPKKQTAGRCSMSVLQVRHFALPLTKQVLDRNHGHLG